MAAIPCRDCATGTIHTGKPTGEVTTIHGIPTYVTRPDAGETEKGLIVFITDIFGWEFPNSRLLADRYAKKGGYAVYVPDFLRGHGGSPKAIELSTAWNTPSSLLYSIFVKPLLLLRTILLLAAPAFHSRRSKSKPLIFNFMRALRADPTTANTKIGVVGFCWGGQYAVLLAQDDSDSGSNESKPLVDAAFTGHPAQLSIPEDIEKVKAPLSMSLAESDMWLKPQARKQVQGLEKGEGYEVVLFPGTNHGFALRQDPKNAVQMAAAEKAEEQALAWFKRWLG